MRRFCNGGRLAYVTLSNCLFRCFLPFTFRSLLWCARMALSNLQTGASGESVVDASMAAEEVCTGVMPVKLRVKRLSENAILPTRGSSGAAGYDLSSAYDYVIPARGKMVVKTDLSVALPTDCYARIGEHPLVIVSSRQSGDGQKESSSCLSKREIPHVASVFICSYSSPLSTSFWSGSEVHDRHRCRCGGFRLPRQCRCRPLQSRFR